MMRWLNITAVIGFLVEGTLLLGANSIAGSVKDARGSHLNGIFVTAERAGATYRTTVFSDDAGKYQFPELVPGEYTVTVQAGGFRTARKSDVVVRGGATLDLEFTLQEETRPEELFRQAVPGEWLASLPGTEKQKFSISKNCTGCHKNLYHIMAHRFTKQDWLKILATMEQIDAIGIPRHNRDDGTALEGRDLPLQVLEPGEWRFGTAEEIADYLSQVQGPGSPWPKIKFHPRPTGKATQAIITEYAIPRDNAVPHDVQLDAEGNAWYNDFKVNYLGKINPKTGEIKEWRLPDKPGIHGGSQNLWIFPDSSEDNVWMNARSQGRVLRFDPKQEKVTGIWERGEMISFEHVDSQNRVGYGTQGRVDLVTGKVIARHKYDSSTAGYGNDIDSRGMGYVGGMNDHDVKVLNPETGKVARYPTPTPNSGPRRSELDEEAGTFWFGEWYGGKIGTFDVKTGKITEYTPSTPFGAFYQAGVDKVNHLGWSFDWHNDRLIRVNPATGEIVEYPMPTKDVESRRTAVDNSTNPPSVWIHGAGNGLIIRVQAP